VLESALLRNWTMAATLLPLLTVAGVTRAQDTNLAGGGAGDYRNVAFWNEPGVQIEVSSHSFRNGAMKNPGSVCPLNRPLVPGGSVSNCWISSEYEHLPQWVWIHFPGPRRIDQVVLYAASMATNPVEFSGQCLPGGSGTFDTLFQVQGARFDTNTLSYPARFKPVVTDNFRLRIERNTASTTPQSWVAELARLEVYGVNATNNGEASEMANIGSLVPKLKSNLNSTKFVPDVTDKGQTVDISTPWYHLVLEKSHVRIEELSWDSLGQGELGVNFLDESGAGPVLDQVFQNPVPPGASALTRTGNVFRYAPVEVAPGAYEQVSIRANERGFDSLASHRGRIRAFSFVFPKEFAGP